MRRCNGSGQSGLISTQEPYQTSPFALSFVMNPVQLVTVVLAVLAVIIDPTTAGISDSAQALRYTCPKKSE